MLGRPNAVTAGQRMFGGAILITVAYVALHYYLFEVVAYGPWTEGPWRVVEFEVANAGHKLPFVLSPYLVAQTLLLGFWAIRPPRPITEGAFVVAAARLSEWLRWSALILTLIGVGVALAFVARRMLAVYFMSLLPLFGVAYTAAVFRCLQINGRMQEEGRSRFSTKALAVGAWLPSMMIPLWPIGLAIPISVWRRVGGSQVAR